MLRRIVCVLVTPLVGSPSVRKITTGDIFLSVFTDLNTSSPSNNASLMLVPGNRDHSVFVGLVCMFFSIYGF